MQSAKVRAQPISNAAVSRPVAARKLCRSSFSTHTVAPRRSKFVIAATGSSSAEETDKWANKYPNWDSIYKQLTGKYNLRSISVDEAAIMMDEGKAVLLDVRLVDDYAESHPAGAVCAPAFRVIKTEDGAGFGRMLKSLLMSANGVTPTEGHPDFPSMAAAAAGSDKAVILACEAGGSILPTANFPTGKASRSLKACWKLLHTGTLPAEKVLHLDGGVLAWYKAGLRMEGDNEYNPARAGRTPNAVPVNKN